MPRPSTPTRLKLGYVALAAADTWLAGRSAAGAHRVRFLTKPLLMPVLSASLATDQRAAGSPLRATTLAAQAGGWGGDVALLASGTKPFLLGAGSFGVGHLAYINGFLRKRSHTPLRENTSAKVAAGTWALSAPAMAVLASRQHRELGVPVLGYATLLAAMAAAASHLDPTVPRSARRLTATGAALFMVSDSLLALGKFAIQEPPPQLETAVMATYAVAQLLLSEGAARA